MTISVAHNGDYTDGKGKLCRLDDKVFKMIGMMTGGQKVLIRDEDGHEGVKI